MSKRRKPPAVPATGEDCDLASVQLWEQDGVSQYRLVAGKLVELPAPAPQRR